jgi:hypothetical protein
MCAMTRLALFALLVIATTRRCGRPRWSQKVDKAPEAA